MNLNANDSTGSISVAGFALPSYAFNWSSPLLFGGSPYYMILDTIIAFPFDCILTLVQVFKLKNKAYFPHQDDFIKLRLEMQKMLNALIHINVSDPMVFGLSLKGLKCQLYTIWLKHDGIYVCREIQGFSLPRSGYEIMLCPLHFINISGFERKNR